MDWFDPLWYGLETLSKPAKAVRGVASGLTGGSWGGGLLNLLPFSETLGITPAEQQVTGRQLAEQWGMADPNQEGLDAGDVAGFGIDFASEMLNPINWILPGIVGKGLKYGRGLMGGAKSAIPAGAEATKAVGGALVPVASKATTLPRALPAPAGKILPGSVDDLLAAKPKQLPGPPSYSADLGSGVRKHMLDTTDPIVASGNYDVHVVPQPFGQPQELVAVTKGHPIPKFKSPEEADELIEKWTQHIAKKYGEQEALYWPLESRPGIGGSINDMRQFYSLPGPLPIDPGDLSAIRAATIGRNAAIEARRKAMVEGMLERVTPGPVKPSLLRKDLSEFLKNTELAKTTGAKRLPQSSVEDLAQRLYATMAKKTWPKADMTWHLDDAIKEVPPKMWGESPEPMLRQLADTLINIIGADKLPKNLWPFVTRNQ